jgi:hypothetical protein
MENVLSIPYVNSLILQQLSINDLFNISCCNKDIRQSISYFSLDMIYNYIQRFYKRLSKISHNDTIKTTNEYLTLYIYYYDIVSYYNCLSNHDKQFIQKDKFVFLIKHIHLPDVIYPHRLSCIYDILHYLYYENKHNYKLKLINGPYINLKNMISNDDDEEIVLFTGHHWYRMIQLIMS